VAVVLVASLVVALIPLASLLLNIIGHGWHYLTWDFLTTPQNPNLTILDHSNIGGISNAITASILIDGMALVIAVPFSIVLAIALFESKGRLLHLLRTYVEVMVGLPSLLFGLFIYNFFVVRFDHLYSALAGTLALSIMMMPVITVNCEAALRSVPSTLIEAGLALGARPSQVMRRVILPVARPRILTGVLLSLSRAVGETAPLLFVIGASFVTDWNPLSQATPLPLLTFNYLGSQWDSQRNAVWGVALVLVIAVFTLNIISRIIVARYDKGRK
jgi:phosphate transport system permease protein